MPIPNSPDVPGYISLWAQSAYLSLKGAAVRLVKFNREFQRVSAALERSEKYSAAEFKNLQDEKLRRLIRHAYEQVPYYRDLFKKRGLTPDDFRGSGDLHKLPLLSKQELRDHAGVFVAESASKRFLASGWTTGSTGAPINALRDRNSIVFENAFIWRQRRWAGVRPSEPKAAVWGTIWSDVIVPSQWKHPPFWRYNWADRQILLSYYHMSAQTLGHYADRLESFAPSLVEGFPSTIKYMADFLVKSGRKLNVKAVFTSSEPLYDAHRSLIEDRFGAKVFDLYGQSERASLATECEAHQGLHENPEYGITEILKEDGSPAGPGESGEIIGTGLNNFAMPLIRYRTGDIATRSTKACACGRHMPRWDRVEGRLADFLVLPDGRRIPGNGVMGAFHGIDNILKTQILQESPERITLRIVEERPGAGIDQGHLIRNLRQCLGNEIGIDVAMIPESELTGVKYRWIVSRCG